MGDGFVGRVWGKLGLVDCLGYPIACTPRGRENHYLVKEYARGPNNWVGILMVQI